MAGQIQITDSLGKWIFDLCKREDVKTIVEIGTWNGQGSTRCVYEAIKGTGKILYSLEIDSEMYKQAIAEYPLNDPNLKLIYGKVTDAVIDLNDYPAYFFSQYSKPVHESWLKVDLTRAKKAPVVLPSLPTAIDLLILDGGEFFSEAEYRLLKDRSRIIVADDTGCIKNFKVRQDMIKHRKIIVDAPSMRNGFVVCEK